MMAKASEFAAGRPHPGVQTALEADIKDLNAD